MMTIRDKMITALAEKFEYRASAGTVRYASQCVDAILAALPPQPDALAQSVPVRGDLAEIVLREAKEWLESSLIDESDKRAVTSFANWLLRVAREKEAQPSLGAGNGEAVAWENAPQEADVDVLADGRCIPAIPDAALWALTSTLHSNVPEASRPMSWSDYSPQQIERLRSAAKAFLTLYAAPQPTTAGYTPNVPRFMEVVRSRWNFEENEFDAIEKVLLDPKCAAALSLPSTDREGA